MIEKVITFRIGEKSFNANFPNVGQIIDMESLKQALSGNRYGAMSASGVKTMYDALDLIDAIAFFKICTPTVLVMFDIEDVINKPLDEFRELRKVYLSTIRPWYEKTLKQLNEATDAGTETKDAEGGSK